MNDFDFYTGTWDVTNRRRVDFLEETCLLEEAREWEEFPAVSRASGHFQGGANFDEIEFPTKGIRVRYLWSGITATSARWEQAFSVDGEKTWITNWIMDSTRR